jgi:hypothetical protein
VQRPVRAPGAVVLLGELSGDVVEVSLVQQLQPLRQPPVQQPAPWRADGA